MSEIKIYKKKRKGILNTLKTCVYRNRLGELLVTKGLISTKELHHALKAQKETCQPLGQIFLKHSVISKKQLIFILSRQLLLRCMIALTFFISASHTKVHADIIDVPARLTISAPNMTQHFTKVSAYPNLFGSYEKRSRNLKPFTKWTSMFHRFDIELKNGKSNQLIRNWQNNLLLFKDLNLKNMANQVNNLINQEQYILDNRNWGKSDYWATPVEFLEHGGDCEDFAIAKYTALRALGVPEERLRVAIVHDNVKNIPHAVLVVYTESGPYILDNQIKTLINASVGVRYRPIFSINRTAWWLHTASSENTIIASAQ
ncbi:MAG: transglutaminase-like cysteine peptidase [Alphaproteobacteria bacterium]|nr:transglutaminase-like cysteine peptidase [Alphaproteobacteria bacterium]